MTTADAGACANPRGYELSPTLPHAEPNPVETRIRHHRSPLRDDPSKSRADIIPGSQPAVDPNPADETQEKPVDAEPAPDAEADAEPAPEDAEAEEAPEGVAEGDEPEATQGDDAPEPEPEPVDATPVDIFDAAARGDLAAIDRAILSEGIDVDLPHPESGATPLIVAAAERAGVDATTLLLDRGADPNAKKTNGDSALHWACYHGDWDVASVLLNAGADVNASGDLRNSPLHMAATGSHEVLCAELLARGANADAKNEFQVVPSSTARGEECVATLKTCEATEEDDPGCETDRKSAARAVLRRRLAAARHEVKTSSARAAREERAAWEAAKELDVAKRKKRFDEEEELRVAEIGRLRKELAEVTQELSDMKVAWDERDKRDEEERLAREAAAAAAAAKDPKGGKKK